MHSHSLVHGFNVASHLDMLSWPTCIDTDVHKYVNVVLWTCVEIGFHAVRAKHERNWEAASKALLCYIYIYYTCIHVNSLYWYIHIYMYIYTYINLHIYRIFYTHVYIKKVSYIHAANDITCAYAAYSCYMYRDSLIMHSRIAFILISSVTSTSCKTSLC